MNLLHINSYYNQGNFYKNFYEIQANKFNIAVYLPVHKGFSNDFDFGKYTRVSESYNYWERAFFYLKHNKILRDIQEKCDLNEFDLLHAHSLFSNGYIARQLKRKYGVPYITAVRNTDVNIFFKYMFHLRRLGISILKEADSIVFLSNPYAELVLSRYVEKKMWFSIEKKIQIIPNGIHAFWLENKFKQYDEPSKKMLKLIYIGNVDKNKNVLTTVDAVKCLRQEGINAQFTVVGRIVNKKIYSKLTEYDFVTYSPFKRREELLALYRAHHIFIMPSFRETFGLVYAEAMTQGLPVVYSKGQGFDKQFEEGTVGYGVHPDSKEEIVIAVKKIMMNYNKISYNCVMYCNKFDWISIEKTYENLYKKVLQLPRK